MPSMSVKLEKDTVYTGCIGDKRLWYSFDCVLISNIRVDNQCWAKGKALAPEYKDVEALQAGEITWDTFKERYLEKLNASFTPQEVYDKYKRRVLVCGESNYLECHRSILLEWLRAAGFKAMELEREVAV